MYDHPAWQQVKERGGGEEIIWDQCMLAEEPEKAARKSSVWLATKAIAEPVKAYFSGMRCNHPAGTHIRLAGVWMTMGDG